MRNALGECINVCNDILAQVPDEQAPDKRDAGTRQRPPRTRRTRARQSEAQEADSSPEGSPNPFEELLSPAEITAKLDEYVIGQEHAKKR